MMRRVLLLAGAIAVVRAADPAEFFEMRVRPVLATNCFSCHTNTSMGGLQMDTRDHLLKGGTRGPAIVPGNPDASLLLQAVRQTHALKMPPGGRLKDSEIADLAEWVKGGAVWGSSVAAIKAPEYVITEAQRTFWAFRPVQNPSV